MWTRKTPPRSGSNIGIWRFLGPRISLRLGVEKTKGFCRNYSRRNSWEWLQFPSDLVWRRGCPYMPCNGLLALHTANSQYAMMETMQRKPCQTNRCLPSNAFMVSDWCSMCELVEIHPIDVLMHGNALAHVVGSHSQWLLQSIAYFLSDKLIQQ